VPTAKPTEGINLMAFSAVLLAAGSSSRMNGEFKQLLPLPTDDGEEPLVRITARALLAAKPQEVIIVTGHRSTDVIKSLADLPLTFQANPRYTEGQMTSVVMGLTALKAPCSAVMICLADLVLVQPDDYRVLVDVFSGLSQEAILVPFHQGVRGNPILFSASRVPEVLSGQINPGCRRLIEDHPEQVVRYESDHDRFCTDLDTPEDYIRLRDRLSNSPRTCMPTIK
jgi:molybdenum cofactor cytidylyltransferase